MRGPPYIDPKYLYPHYRDLKKVALVLGNLKPSNPYFLEAQKLLLQEQVASNPLP